MLSSHSKRSFKMLRGMIAIHRNISNFGMKLWICLGKKSLLLLQYHKLSSSKLFRYSKLRSSKLLHKLPSKLLPYNNNLTSIASMNSITIALKSIGLKRKYLRLFRDSATEILAPNRDFGTEILAPNRDFGTEPRFWHRTEILAPSRDFGTEILAPSNLTHFISYSTKNKNRELKRKNQKLVGL